MSRPNRQAQQFPAWAGSSTGYRYCDALPRKKPRAKVAIGSYRRVGFANATTSALTAVDDKFADGLSKPDGSGGFRLAAAVRLPKRIFWTDLSLLSHAGATGRRLPLGA
jgi:hypothetical protein